MKKIILIIALPLLVFSQNFRIEGLRTELYSKADKNALKKIELSLELEGQKLQDEQAKILDSINTIISSFFYEDIFTESGKNKFKQILIQFSKKKYKIQIDNIYILSINGVKEFDLKEFKRFVSSLDSNAQKQEDLTKTENNLSIKIPEPNQLIKPILENIDENKDEEDSSLNLPIFPPKP